MDRFQVLDKNVLYLPLLLWPKSICGQYMQINIQKQLGSVGNTLTKHVKFNITISDLLPRMSPGRIWNIDGI